MALTAFNEDMEIISKLSDLPNDTDGLTPAELKERFDRAGKLLKQYINGVLLAELAGASAAGSLGVGEVNGTDMGANIQAALDALAAQIAETSLGAIPDRSLTEAKFADLAVSTRALGELSVTPGKLSNDGIPIEKGGTGATTAAGALSNLGAAAASHTHAASAIASGTLNTSRLPTIPITKGGTGATTAAAALTNLGALAASKLVAIYNAGVTFTEGKATYTNSAITASSVVFVARRVGTAGSTNVHAFGTTSNSGSVTICASDTFSASINLNILIFNP